MASQPPSSEAQIASPAQKASAAEFKASVDEAEMDSNASMSGESASPPPNRPNQPKMTPRAIGKRRRRNASRAVKKSLQDINSGTRLARQRRDQFNYQQKQNRAWLQHQVQLPSRGGVPRHAEVELQAFFRKDEIWVLNPEDSRMEYSQRQELNRHFADLGIGTDTPADPITNLPTLGSGKSLSLDGQAAWEQLKEERETVRVAIGTEFTPTWFATGDISKMKRTKGEKRAATRERKRLMEEGAGLFEGLGLGGGEKEVKGEGQLMEVGGEDSDEGGVKTA